MTTTGPTRTLVIEREMPHPQEKIWRALTEGKLMEEWLMKNDFQPVVGHRFDFRAHLSDLIMAALRVLRQHQMGTGLRKAERNGPPDALRCAGHDRDLVIQSET